MTAGDIDIGHLSKWIGRSERREEVIAPFPSNALAATLDRDDPPCEDGTPLPPLWHWLHFHPVFPLSAAGYDGHAALGGFLPPVPLPRRMWAGSTLRFLAPVRIGRHLAKTSTVEDVRLKRGRSGDLVFVTARHRVHDGAVLCIDETHDIVYRAPAGPSEAATPPAPAPRDSAWTREVRPDPVLLFRYSALTFNGHRIHYDRDFCTASEGYEGLVVHGPLLATLLLDLLRRERPGAAVAEFSFRARAPVFDTAPFTLHGEPGEDGAVRLWVRRSDAALAMEATATTAAAG